MFYFKLVRDGEITSVESKSVNIVSPGFTSATKGEYDTFISGLPVPMPVPQRDLIAEIDTLTSRVSKLEGRK